MNNDITQTRNYRSVNARLNELLSTSKNKSYFVAAVTVGFIVIMVMLGILPAYSAFTFQTEENTKRDELISKLDNKLTISKSLSTESNDKSNLVDYFNQVFPNDRAQSNIFDIVSAKIDTYNLTLDTINFTKAQSGFILPSQTDQVLDPQVAIDTVNFTVEGSQQALLDFVGSIETSRRIMNITSLTISKKSADEIAQSPTKGDFRLILQIKYFYYLAQSDTNS